MSKENNIEVLSADQLKQLKVFKITYGVAETPFGNCLLAVNEDRVCFSAFFDGKTAPVDEIKKLYPGAELTEDDEAISKIADGVFNKNGEKVGILVKGTDFEANVWREIANLKKGTTTSYEGIAKALGNPKAIRAVARAVSKNHVGYLIPCHRVISKTGGLSKYKWGAQRKMRILKEENAI